MTAFWIRPILAIWAAVCGGLNSVPQRRGVHATLPTGAGGTLFQSSTGVIRPIFATPAVSKDGQGNLWVYWGTGDKTDPTAAASGVQEKFYAAKDNDRTTSLGISNLDNITSSTYSDSATKHGWYININIAGSGEKILSDATVFGGVVYFTTYVPPSGADPCSQAGEAKLWGVELHNRRRCINSPGGAPVGTTPSRSMSIGTGIATTPVVSFKPLGAMPP